MKTIYTLELPESWEDTIYLAGCTHREPGHKSWREDALDFFKMETFEGTLIIPEYRDNKQPDNWTYERQVSWEHKAMDNSKVILFWIPRDAKQLPGFTSNIEFGEYLFSGKIVMGFPKEAYRTRYITERCLAEKIPLKHSIGSVVRASIRRLISLSAQVTWDAPRIWFTADNHFGHERTLQLSKRPFRSVEEMNWQMVARWNSIIKPLDLVYHLGDFGDIKFLDCLNGIIVFIRGNYDTDDFVNDATKRGFKVLPYLKQSIPDDGSNIFCMVHAPVITPAEGDEVFYLYGHIHKLQMVKRNGLNVGVDCHNFYPISLDDVMFYKNAILNFYDKNVFIDRLGGEK